MVLSARTKGIEKYPAFCPIRENIIHQPYRITSDELQQSRAAELLSASTNDGWRLP
jgi:hypothetical protein